MITIQILRDQQSLRDHGAARAQERVRVSPHRDQWSQNLAELPLAVTARQPYCPLNGLLVLVPLAATDSDDDAQNTAECLQRDLQTLRAVLKVDCPQFALLCDLEMLCNFAG